MIFSVHFIYYYCDDDVYVCRMCMCGYKYNSVHVETRGQFCGIGSPLLLFCGFWRIKPRLPDFYGKHLYQLSHLTGHQIIFLPQPFSGWD